MPTRMSSFTLLAALFMLVSRREIMAFSLAMMFTFHFYSAAMVTKSKNFVKLVRMLNIEYCIMNRAFYSVAVFYSTLGIEQI